MSNCKCGAPVNIGVELCKESAIMPEVNGANAGIDLRVLVKETLGVEEKVLLPNECVVLGTGIKLDIPEGYYVKITVRSSAGIKKHLRLMNTEAIIDSPYKGEILIGLHNFGTQPTTIADNERICQMIVKRVENVQLRQVSTVGTSERGEGGIGSTGRF